MAKKPKPQSEAEMPEWWRRLANAIRAHQARGHSWAAISRAAGFDRDARVYEMVNNLNMPHVDTFLGICSAIGASPISILLGFDWTEDEQRAAQILASLDPEAQELVIRFAEQSAKARRHGAD